MKRTAPYGTWESPVDVAAAVGGKPIARGRFGSVDGVPGVWYSQLVSEQGGALVLFWAPLHDPAERVQITSLGLSVTSRVNEYGGGSWAVVPDTGQLVFVENDSQSIFTLTGEQVALIVASSGVGGKRFTADDGRRLVSERRRITPDTDGDVRYGDLTVSQGVLLAVREEHDHSGARTRVTQSIVEVDLDGEVDEWSIEAPDEPRILMEAPADFVAWPRLSPDRTLLVCVGWDRPHMPWDETGLYAVAVNPQPYVPVTTEDLFAVRVGPAAEAPTGSPSTPAAAAQAPGAPAAAQASGTRASGTPASAAQAAAAGPAVPPLRQTLYPSGPVHRIWHRADVSSLQPEWLSGRTLSFTEDSSGRWTVVTLDAPSAYRRACGESGVPPPETTVCVRPRSREHTENQAFATSASDAELPSTVVQTSTTLTGEIGGPLWKLGSCWYLPVSNGSRILAENRSVRSTLLWADPRTGDVRDLACPLDWLRLQDFDTATSTALVVGGAGHRVSGLYTYHVPSGELRAMALEEDTTDISSWYPTPELWSFDGVHTIVYPPFNPEVQGPPDERPPYVVFVHGGPTDQVMPAASALAAFYTSRGVGVAAVNYSGSTGFGRPYRVALNGQWGVADVEDVVTVAKGLAAAELADPARLAVSGGSAGGWTVLCALTLSDVFVCGASKYGVADLLDFARDTARFESHYSHSLVAPTPGTEALHWERSPLSRAERMTVPVALFQGEHDTVVHPVQTRRVIDALERNGTPYVCRFYADEGHGFTSAEVEGDVLTAEFGFYAKIMGFLPHDVPPVRLQGRGRGGYGPSMFR